MSKNDGEDMNMDSDARLQSVEIVLPDGSTTEGTFHIWRMDPANNHKVKLMLAYSGKELTAIEYDYFTAMVGIRRELEKDGIRLRCYGASKNVYPSRMAIEMGAGAEAYKKTLGQSANTSDLVSIFDSGPDVEPATIDEQRAFYKTWIDSLG
jgi:hypothetical protein